MQHFLHKVNFPFLWVGLQTSDLPFSFGPRATTLICFFRGITRRAWILPYPGTALSTLVVVSLASSSSFGSFSLLLASSSLLSLPYFRSSFSVQVKALRLNTLRSGKFTSPSTAHSSALLTRIIRLYKTPCRPFFPLLCRNFCGSAFSQALLTHVPHTLLMEWLRQNPNYNYYSLALFFAQCTMISGPASVRKY